LAIISRIVSTIEQKKQPLINGPRRIAGVNHDLPCAEAPALLDGSASRVAAAMRREQINEMLIYTIARQLVILSAWNE
jgi:hypothetical protein